MPGLLPARIDRECARRQAPGGSPVALEKGVLSPGRRHLGMLADPMVNCVVAEAGRRGGLAGGLRLSSIPAMEAPAVCLLPLLLLLWAWAPAPGRASPEALPLVNEDVKRTVDLSSHLAKVTAEVVLAHAGSSSSPRATSFLLALEPELEARLAHLGVQVSWGRGGGDTSAQAGGRGLGCCWPGRSAIGERGWTLSSAIGNGAACPLLHV